MRNSDICLSIRNIRSETASDFGSLEAAVDLIGKLRPTRIEWSYIRDREQIARLTGGGAVFVSALNTVFPPGRAKSFEGEPVVAPWMKGFATPSTRRTYMCQNHPDDVQARIDQASEMIDAGITGCFQHDDWYCNAQMIGFGNPCFCDYCREGFAEYLGIEIDYLDYLHGRGIWSTQQLLDLAKEGAVPLWDDYNRFAEHTVTRYFRKLRANMDRFLGGPATLSVNGSVAGFGGSVDTIAAFLSYFNGETWDFSPAGLRKLAAASRSRGILQVVSFFPDVPVEQFHSPPFVARVNHAVALCYCLGLLPLFPYDVWAGPDAPARWFGTWQEYHAPYEIVRDHPDWFDDYEQKSVKLEKDRSVVISRHKNDPGKALRHVIGSDGTWQTAAQ